MPVETAFAKATDPSTYQDSCSTIEVVGATLRAVCRRRDGSFNAQTAIRIRGIDNVEGKLTYARHPTAISTYQDSCENIDAIGATLMAKCRRRDGSFNEKTTIRIRGIDNVNGKLAYSK
jgi:CVNH domain